MKKLIFILTFFVAFEGLLAQPGINFFNFPNVHTIRINFYEVNYLDSLTYYKSLADQTGVEKYIAADVIINTDTVKNVGIRFRGNSSYNHPGTKKPIQLDFNEFVSGQKYDDLKKLNLNNSYLDPSQIREKLFMDLLKEYNVPAPRMTFTTVYFNGTYVGLYKALEPINKQFLEAYFSNDDGNLFKCEPNTPLTWEGNTQSSYYDNAELKTNESINDWSYFINLMDVINHSGNNFENNLSAVFNIDNYIKGWAMNMVLGNLDSYMYLPHNYYLYHNTSSDKMEWITWDASLAFGVYAFLVVPNSIDFDILYLPDNAESTRPLNYYILNTPSLKQKYLNEICAITKNQFLPNEIFHRIDSLSNIIRPYVNSEPVSNQMFSPNEFENNLEYTTVSFQLIGQVPGLKEYVQTRRISIAKQLCDLNWSCSAGEEIITDEVMNVYPNPGNNFTIDQIAPNDFYATDFFLYDLSGKKVAQFTDVTLSGTHYLNTDHLAEGMYILKMSSGCKNESKKIVITR